MGGMLQQFERFVDNGDGRETNSAGISLLGEGITVEGDVTGPGNLRIDGHVEGSVIVDGSVEVGRGGVVEGSIEARKVVAAGRISGEIRARKLVRLEDGCRVEGEIRSPAVALEDGGILDGHLWMDGASG